MATQETTTDQDTNKLSEETSQKNQGENADSATKPRTNKPNEETATKNSVNKVSKDTNRVYPKASVALASNPPLPNIYQQLQGLKTKLEESTAKLAQAEGTVSVEKRQMEDLKKSVEELGKQVTEIDKLVDEYEKARQANEPLKQKLVQKKDDLLAKATKLVLQDDITKIDTIIDASEKEAQALKEELDKLDAPGSISVEKPAESVFEANMQFQKAEHEFNKSLEAWNNSIKRSSRITELFKELTALSADVDKAIENQDKGCYFLAKELEKGLNEWTMPAANEFKTNLETTLSKLGAAKAVFLGKQSEKTTLESMKAQKQKELANLQKENRSRIQGKIKAQT